MERLSLKEGKAMDSMRRNETEKFYMSQESWLIMTEQWAASLVILITMLADVA